MTGYDTVRGSAHDSQRGAIFDAQRTGYDPQRGPAYDASRASGYEAQSRGAAPPMNNMPYGSATPPGRTGAGYEAPPRGGNMARR